jgi:hypothetical protein
MIIMTGDLIRVKETQKEAVDIIKAARNCAEEYKEGIHRDSDGYYRPFPGQRYWYNTKWEEGNGKTVVLPATEIWRETAVDYYRMQNHNVYLTFEEAEKEKGKYNGE